MTTPLQPPSPTQPNAERALVRLVREAAATLGVGITALGEGWILRLDYPLPEGGGRGWAGPGLAPGSLPPRFIHGYSFDLNPAATHQICCDKAATAETLAHAGVPCVPHRLFLHPDMARYVPHHGTWEGLLSAWRAWNSDVVVKENEGTGGRGVVRCRTIVELEQAVYRLFNRTPALALSPYVAIEHEYRFVMLNGACECVYEKIRASVTGDGARSLLSLMGDHSHLRGVALAGLLENLDEHERAALALVLPAGETRVLNWRHNLGQGATARVLTDAQARATPAWDIAHRAAAELGLRFGSVDVVQVAGPTPRHWAVLEVNSGVMMEFLAKTVDGGDALARRVYTKALRAMFPDL